MPGKTVPCPHCSKVMRSDNLKNHVRRHGRFVEAPNFTTQHKKQRSPEIPTFNFSTPVSQFQYPSLKVGMSGAAAAKTPKIPKLQALVNEITNDSSTEKPRAPVLPQKSAGVLPIPPTHMFQEIVLPPLPPLSEIVSDVFQNTPKTKTIDYTDDEEESPIYYTDTEDEIPRTKGNIMGYSNDNSDADGQSTDEGLETDDQNPCNEQTSPPWYQRTPAADQYSDDDNSVGRPTDIATYAWRDQLPSDAVKSTDNHEVATYAWRDDGSSIKKNHSFLLPRDVRAIIVGKSGFGKTTLLTSLLLEPDMMDYEKLMVCGKSLHQPEYRAMQLGFNKGLSKNQIRKIFKRQDDVMQDGGPEKVISDVKICKGGVDASFFNDVTMIPDPSEEDPLQRNLLVMLCWDHRIK